MPQGAGALDSSGKASVKDAHLPLTWPASEVQVMCPPTLNLAAMRIALGYRGFYQVRDGKISLEQFFYGTG
jgi:hypothetical protein